MASEKNMENVCRTQDILERQRRNKQGQNKVEKIQRGKKNININENIRNGHQHDQKEKKRERGRRQATETETYI